METLVDCKECGAPNLGTPFCETCGARAEELPAPAPTASTAPAPTQPVTVSSPVAVRTRVGATPVRVWALIFLLLAGILPGILDLAIKYLPELYRGSTIALVSATGLFALIAALAGRAGAGGKLFGAIFAIAYVGLSAFLFYGNLPYLFPYSQDVLFVTSYVLLFLSWGLGRPFRGPGYFGLLILPVVGALNTLVRLIPGLYDTYAIGLATDSAVFAISVWLVVGLPIAFERRPSGIDVRSPTPIGIDSTNSLARLALVFALSAIGVQILSTLLSLAGFYYISVGAGPVSLVLFVLAIIFGHIGRSQVKRSGERGGGQALAALIICYGLIGLGVVAAIVQWIILASLFSSYY